MKEIVECIGSCGKTQPVYDDSNGHRKHIGSWLCADCHLRLCGTTDLHHKNCKARQALDEDLSPLEKLAWQHGDYDKDL